MKYTVHYIFTLTLFFIIFILHSIHIHTICNAVENIHILPVDSEYFEEGNKDKIIGKPQEDNITASIEDTWDVVFEVVGNIAKFVLILIPSIAMLMIVYGGFKYVQGSLDSKSEGKQIIQYAIIGFIIAMLAYVIASLILAVIIGSTND